MNRTVSVIGLGYVGLPLAVAFARKCRVVGFDVNNARVNMLRSGEDATGEVSAEELAAAGIHFTSDESDLREADFHIVAVPTPVDHAHRPDLSLVVRASETVGRNLSPGSVVVFESTVYPGVTEEVAVPALERASGMACGRDFKVGYSPERINPGDKEHAFSKIVKVVSGMDSETLDVVAEVYGAVVEAGVFRAASIKTAEAAKVIENTQRDLNIALMNELAMIFRRLGLDTSAVLEAAATKWNFLRFTPGLVGGHCIGVDPYYLTYKAEAIGYHPQVILAGRRINDGMGKYVAEQTIKALVHQEVNVRQARVSVLGLAFKENVPDIRNSKVVDIVRELEEYGMKPAVHDPYADPAEARAEYGIELAGEKALARSDAAIVAVPHQAFREKGAAWVRSLLRRPDRGVVMDVKSMFRAGDFPGSFYWRL